MIQAEANLKIIILGENGVGKSTLFHRLAEGTFKSTTTPTLCSDFKFVYYPVKDNTFLRINLWDTSGQEKYRTVQAGYYRNADVVLLCYDLTNAKSLDQIEFWSNQIKVNCQENPPQIILIGCKKDLKPQIKESILLDMLKKTQIYYNAKVSAKTGENIQSLVEIIIKEKGEVKLSQKSIKEIQSAKSIQGAEGTKQENKGIKVGSKNQSNKVQQKKSCF